MVQAIAAPPQNVVFQGIEVPAESVNPAAFFAGTRRQRSPLASIATWQGFGNTDTITMRRSGVLAALNVRVHGTVTTLKGTGTIATTWRFPYDVARFRFTANGQSNLINAHGWPLKARAIMRRGDLDDRGVARGVGGASPGTSRTQGTLSLNSETWGLGQGVTAIADGTYDVDLFYEIPVADDLATLLGAVFAQTTATSLDLNIDWAQKAELFTLTNDAAVTMNLGVTVEPIIYSIPPNGSGGIWLPDLSAFHSLVENRVANGVGNGNNEHVLVGQGVGKQLERVFWRVFNNGVPLTVNSTNYDNIYWGYGLSDMPETFDNGWTNRQAMESLFSNDFGLEGFVVLDWAKEWAFRDTIDEGAATDLRIGYTIPAGVALTSPAIEYVQETIFAGAAVA